MKVLVGKPFQILLSLMVQDMKTFAHRFVFCFLIQFGSFTLERINNFNASYNFPFCVFSFQQKVEGCDFKL